ncbi:hypothetical protein CBR_g51564 [Chara braunii]|uniref:Uncharacterized protein n=1 Tax=Chara braunii TaxID=69332 RepID=A0A388M8T1_CHABU|nr:hypothetical protein CBR_g51564 [Chara braunii]|eukprot:GBG90960.1 hypothetical protein CBR_g51564 [Chara braunii]
MLDCQAGLEVEPVRTGTRRGMTEEAISRQVALITQDPIWASAPPSADFVFGRRACIFGPYPREDDSDKEPVPEAADDPALRIPREIDETHDDPNSEETRAHTARRAADRADREMLGGEEEFWGPFEEVASTGGTEARVTTPTPTRRGSSMLPPLAPSRAPPSYVSPLQPATATANTEELGSSLPQRGLLHRRGAVRQLRLRSPSPGILQEEGAPSAAAVEGGMAPAALADATITVAVDEIAAAAVLEEMAASLLEEEAPAAGGAAAVEGQVAAARGAAGVVAAVEVEGAVAVEEEEAPSVAAVEGGVEGPVEEEIATQAEAFARGLDEARLRETWGDCVQGAVVAGEDVVEGVAAELVDEALSGGAEAADVAVEGRPQAVDEAVHAGQRRDEGAIDARRMVQETATGSITPPKRGVPPRPRPVPAAGGAALGKSLGVEGLGMPRGSRREQAVAEACARVVRLGKGGNPVTIEEDDPDMDAAVRQEDEDYEGEEEGEKDSRSGSDGDDDDDYDEPPPPRGPPPT